jgi:hypothetical protein
VNDVTATVKLNIVSAYTPLHSFTYNTQNYQISNAGASNVTWFEAKATCDGWNSLSPDDQVAAEAAGLNAADYATPLDEDGAGWFLPDKDFLVGTTVEWGDKLPNGASRFWSSTILDATNAWHVKNDGAESSREKSMPSIAIGFRCLRQVP